MWLSMGIALTKDSMAFYFPLMCIAICLEYVLWDKIAKESKH